MIVVSYPYEYGSVDNQVFKHWVDNLVSQTQQFMYEEMTDTEMQILLQKWYKEILKMWVHFKQRLRDPEFKTWLLEYVPLMFEHHDQKVDGGSLTTLFEDILSEDEFLEMISKTPQVRYSIHNVKSELVKSMMRLMR